jgi:hypothetical protein
MVVRVLRNTPAITQRGRGDAARRLRIAELGQWNEAEGAKSSPGCMGMRVQRKRCVFDERNSVGVNNLAERSVAAIRALKV